jgi:transposase
MQAARLLEKGYSEAEVARRVGVHRQSVNRWAKELAAGGRAALKRAGRAGRKPRLTAADLLRIEVALKEGAEAQGYGTSLWTARRVADLIERLCGVRFSMGHVWRILREELGWSPQRPAGRALERDEKAIRRWKKRRWPELKKTPQKKAGQSSSSTRVD